MIILEPSFFLHFYFSLVLIPEILYPDTADRSQPENLENKYGRKKSRQREFSAIIYKTVKTKDVLYRCKEQHYWYTNSSCIIKHKCSRIVRDIRAWHDSHKEL